MRTLYFRPDLPRTWDAISELVDDGNRYFSRLSADEKNTVLASLVQDMPGELTDLIYPQGSEDVVDGIALLIRAGDGAVLRTALNRAIAANYGDVIDQLFEQIHDENTQKRFREMRFKHQEFSYDDDLTASYARITQTIQ